MRLAEVLHRAEECQSWSALYRMLHNGRQPNSRTLKTFRLNYEGLIDTDHFTANGRKKLDRVLRKCPVCSKVFEDVEGGAKQKTTCSYSCSNTLFNTGTYRGESYRSICFTHHEKMCIVCGEDKIVHVHHYDEDHENDDPANLVPLCPTHHQYCHSRHKHLIEKDVDEYVEKFKMSGSSSAVE